MQYAIKGICRDGQIIPLEDVPSRQSMNVIIVFLDNDDESRYEKEDWQATEKQATLDYQLGQIGSAESIDKMFEQIERNSDGN